MYRANLITVHRPLAQRARLRGVLGAAAHALSQLLQPAVGEASETRRCFSLDAFLGGCHGEILARKVQLGSPVEVLIAINLTKLALSMLVSVFCSKV